MNIFSSNLSGVDGEPNQPLVVVFHGWGASMYDLWGIAQFFPTNWSWRFVHGPLSLGSGSAGWFPRNLRIFESQDPMDYFHNLPRELKDELRIIGSYVSQILENDLKEDRPIILAGFSQGAITALGLTFYSILPIHPSLVLAFSPTLWEGLLEDLERKGKDELPPMFMSHGRQDPVLPYGVTEKLAKTISQRNDNFEFYPFTGSHEIPPDALARAGNFCSTYLASYKIGKS
ncbi:MAG: hypothetical protein GW949_07910 [Spirochaetales bacterium]|nr:hypothetical protein [Spirochaetales bacterium]